MTSEKGTALIAMTGQVAIPSDSSSDRPGTASISVIDESPLANVKLHRVSNIADVLQMREWVSFRRDTPLGVDTETTGLAPQRDRLRLIQLGDKFHGWAVPDTWSGAATEILEDYEDDFVAHNSQFDHRFIEHSIGHFIPWHKLHDTMIIAALADPTRPKGLKPLSARLIDRRATAGERLLHDGMKANGWTWATVPADFPPYWAYAALDPVLTCWIWDILSPDVLETASEAYDLERSVTPILAGMMDKGLLLDKAYTEKKLSELRQFSAKARTWLKDVHGITSLMSARQIDAALRNLDLVISARTKTGLPSIDKETLQLLSVSPEVTPAVHDLAKTILRARHAEKLAGTYLENFLEIVAPDGAIHPSVNQLQARTGRMSCSEPNLQNLPRDDKLVRGCFVPHPGYVLVSIDASQIELRLAAHLCADPELIRVLNEADESGRDVYSEIASTLYGELITKGDPRRQATKSSMYTKIYGGSVKKIALVLGLTRAEAQKMNDMVDERFSRLSSFSAELISRAKSQQLAGEVPYTRTDTGRYLPCEPGREYALFNYITQSTAAEALKRGLQSLASAGFGPMLELPVHDEVILECKAEEADDVLAAALDILHERERYLVGLPWDGKIMPERWLKG